MIYIIYVIYDICIYRIYTYVIYIYIYSAVKQGSPLRPLQATMSLGLLGYPGRLHTGAYSELVQIILLFSASASFSREER